MDAVFSIQLIYETSITDQNVLVLHFREANHRLVYDYATLRQQLRYMKQQVYNGTHGSLPYL